MTGVHAAAVSGIQQLDQGKTLGMMIPAPEACIPSEDSPHDLSDTFNKYGATTIAPWLNPDDGVAPVAMPPEFFPGKDQGLFEDDKDYVFRRFKDLYRKIKQACEAAYPGDADKVDRCVSESLAKVIDTDGDGKISEQELRDFLKKLLGWGDYASGILRDRIFKGSKGDKIPQFDKNCDGFLDATELEELYKWLKEKALLSAALSKAEQVLSH